MIKYIPEKYKRYKAILDDIISRKNEPLKERVLIIDGLNLYIRAFCVVPTINENGDHTGGVYGSLISLKYAIKHLNPSRCIIVFDGRGGSSKRRKIYPEYKSGRRGLKGLNRTYDWLNEKQEEKSAIDQLNRFIQYLDCLPITSITANGVEADDIIAYLSNEVFSDTKRIIMSTDKDFLQLVDDDVTIWSPTKKEIIDTNVILKRYGIHPKNFTLLRIFEGDASDNIPGIKGIGIKTVQKFYPELANERKITLDEIIKITEKNIDIKKFKDIFNNRSILERNFELMQLNNVDINGVIKATILDVVTNQKISLMNELKLRKMFLEDKLIKQIKSLSIWRIDFQQLSLSAALFNKKLTS